MLPLYVRERVDAGRQWGRGGGGGYGSWQRQLMVVAVVLVLGFIFGMMDSKALPPLADNKTAHTKED